MKAVCRCTRVSGCGHSGVGRTQAGERRSTCTRGGASSMCRPSSPRSLPHREDERCGQHHTWPPQLPCHPSTRICTRARSSPHHHRLSACPPPPPSTPATSFLLARCALPGPHRARGAPRPEGPLRRHQEARRTHRRQHVHASQRPKGRGWAGCGCGRGGAGGGGGGLTFRPQGIGGRWAATLWPARHHLPITHQHIPAAVPWAAGQRPRQQPARRLPPPSPASSLAGSPSPPPTHT